MLAYFSVTIDSSASGGGTNNPPTASFTSSCTGLTCTFDGTPSTDTDGTIVSYAWNFGDGNSGSGINPEYSYSAGGTYTVTLTVTDSGEATDQDSHSVTVSAGGSITLTVVGYKKNGLQKADLSWTPSGTSANVDVKRNGVVVTTTPNDGAYTDNINKRGGGSYTYQVCEAGTAACSNVVTISF